MAQRPGRSTVIVLAGVVGALLSALLVPTSATAGPEAAADESPKGAWLVPNMRVLKAADLHVVRTGSGRKLRFESGLANVGDGPIEVRPNRAEECPPGKHHSSQIFYRDANGNGRYDVDVDTRTARRSAGCMVFHRYHDHWHFEAASRYTLYKAHRPRVSKVAQRKMSFCLRDSRRVPKYMGEFDHAERYGACSRYSPQGISVGWVDVYESFLAGQAINLPSRMREGLYCLHIEVDPQDQLRETKENDNTSMRAFYMKGDRISIRKSVRCRPPA